MLKFKDKNLAEGYTEYESQKYIEKSRPSIHSALYRAFILQFFITICQ